MLDAISTGHWINSLNGSGIPYYLLQKQSKNGQNASFSEVPFYVGWWPSGFLVTVNCLLWQSQKLSEVGEVPAPPCAAPGQGNPAGTAPGWWCLLATSWPLGKDTGITYPHEITTELQERFSLFSLHSAF